MSDDGQLELLEQMFRVQSNVPSTPSRAHTGEVRQRTIWAYWAQGYDDMPDFFKLCVSTWQHYNPHWDVRIVQQSTVHEYLSEAELPNRFYQMVSHQTASDAVRLGLMARYGGVWMDVSILLRTDLDSLCWNALAQKDRAAAVFYHPHYGTDEFEQKDLTESWFLATLPGNPFFLKWRDLFRELLHNRLNVDGLLQHPLYQNINLEGIHRLNLQFGAGFDFREYLAIHSMCHRLVEKDGRARAQWETSFQRMDAAETAFRLQLQAEVEGKRSAEVLLSMDQGVDAKADGIPLIKFTTPHYAPLLMLSREQLTDRRHLLGRLLTPQQQEPVGGQVGSNTRSGGGVALGALAGRRGFSTATTSSMATAAAVRARSRRLLHMRSPLAFGLPVAASLGLLASAAAGGRRFRQAAARQMPARLLPAAQALQRPCPVPLPSTGPPLFSRLAVTP